MTREQAINSMISHGFKVEQVGEIIKAVTLQEPSNSEIPNKSENPTSSNTRNCFGCKYSKDNHNAGIEECHLCMWENQYTPTTKNDLVLIHTEGLDEEIRCTMCTNSMKSDRGCDGSCVVNKDMYKAVIDAIEKRIQLTTKNNLGVDCINRATVLHLINDVKNSDGFKNYSQYEYLFDQVDMMPSVTPQLSVPEVTTLAEWTEKLTKASEDAYNKGYADGMKAQEPRWIPTSERLPEEDGEYYAAVYDTDENYKYMDIAELEDGTWQYKDYVKVLAWMPLPKPYKAETEE